MTVPARSTQSLIDELVRVTGATSPEEAIRIKTCELIATHVHAIGEPSIPMNMDVLASLRSISRADEKPLFSPDAELSPDGAGGVTMRVNPDRPETRQRFSIAHEISHTFFPDYETKDWCRTDARYRNRANPAEFLEMLCDIAAAELLFPQPWFDRDAATVQDASDLAALATKYLASREATIRRFAETSSEDVVAVYFVWKLKPTQKGTVGRKDQGNLFEISPEELRQDALRLRIEYSVPSPAFRAAGYYLPIDKSIENNGPVYEAAATGMPATGECFLDLGQAAGKYRVLAVPLWTTQNERGASDEHAVAAVLRPLSVRKPSRSKAPADDERTLFNEL
ncbi:ImmA/IrrE family metallo-endopeptidase [Symmachiella dynata]|uniref:ImmA/IrrE family metallo-endopeptidase n=1 Tax=Symmachiella dynata TaxID=2527995 RepID=UPI0030EB3986